MWFREEKQWTIKRDTLRIQMLITGNTVDTTQAGEFTITYSVTDSDGITEAESRLIVVFDPDRPSNTTPPRIMLNGDADRYIYKNEAYDEWGAFAYDLEDGYLGDRIAISGTVTTTSGNYEITYTVTDDADISTSLIRTVHVMGELDHIPPSLVLIGDKFIFRTVGDSYVDPGYTAIDNVDDDITPQVITNGSPDMSKPGFYFIGYKVCDSSGNYSFEDRHIVVRGAGEPAYPLFSINKTIHHGTANWMRIYGSYRSSL